MNKNIKQMKAAKAKAEEAVLNRILYWFAGGAVLECILLFINRYLYHYVISEFAITEALHIGVRYVAVGALACAAAALFWWNGARKSGKNTGLPGTLALFMAGLSMGCFATWFGGKNGLKFAYVAVPVVFVLALIFYLYQKEFFVITLQSAFSLLGVWICGEGLNSTRSVLCYVYVAVAAVAVLIGALLCRKAQSGEGEMEWNGKKLRLFPKDANYAILYAGALVALAVLAAAALGVVQMVLYGVAVAWILIMAVYYTVKLM